MKNEILTSLLIVIAVTILSIALMTSIVNNATLDIQFHDTYIVLDRLTTTLLISTPLILLTFLVRGAINQFKTVGTNTGIILGLVLSGYFESLFFLTFEWTWAFGLVFAEGAVAIILAIRTIKTGRG
jgi:hypothetical protein